MKNIFITLLIATTLSSCLNFAVRALAYPKWKPHYKVQEGKVFYFFPDAAGGSGILVKGADPKTFEQLSYEWGKDASFVFLDHRKIPSIDRRSFRNVKGRFYRDKNHIYHGGGVCQETLIPWSF